MANSSPLFDPSDPCDEHRILAPDVLPPPVVCATVPSATTGGAPTAEPAGLGHNGPPPEGDPGPDQNFAITLDLPEEVRNRRDCKAFEQALREQGDHEHRLAALDQAAWRVRANQAVPHVAHRLYTAMLDMARGKYRCFISNLHALCMIAGLPNARNASRVIDALEQQPDTVAIFKYIDGRIGDPKACKLLIAPVVTVEDRSSLTIDRILKDAGMAAGQQRAQHAEYERNRYHRAKAAEAEPVLNVSTEKVCTQDEAVCTQDEGHSPYNESIKRKSDANASHAPSHNGRVKQGTSTQGTSSAAPASSPQPQPSLPELNGAVDAHDGNGAAPPKRGRRRAPAVHSAEVDQAIQLYNEAAQQHGFTPFNTRTPEVMARLQRRLIEIGGIERFKLALSAIPGDDWLMGRVKKDGRRPFKLEMDRLLQAGGGMGDVLAKLIDRAISERPKARPAKFEDLSGELHRSQTFLRHLALDPQKPWPEWAPPIDLFHPQALFEAGFHATKGSS
jgi:hypothetical protein